MEEEKKQEPRQPRVATEKGEKRRHKRVVPRILGGDVLQSRQVLKRIPLIILLCFYALVLVYCRYRVEDLTKEKIEAQERINYLRETRIELQKRYQETIKISEIAELLDSTGVGITAGPPYELRIGK